MTERQRQVAQVHMLLRSAIELANEIEGLHVNIEINDDHTGDVASVEDGDTFESTSDRAERWTRQYGNPRGPFSLLSSDGS